MTASPQRTLVVGASGQVGRQLVLALGRESVIEAGRDIIDLSLLSRNCAAAKQIVRDGNIRSVYCVGGATDVERCESDRQWAMETNCRGPAVLASLCAQVPFVYFSSEYVFDGKAGPYTESSPINPICAYGESKALGEAAILKAHPAPAIVRTTVVYGEDPGGKNFLYSLHRNLSAKKRMRVPVDQVSTPTYNCDLARASIDIVDAGRSGVFHVCGPDRLSRYDFAAQFTELTGLDKGLIDGVPTAELGQNAPRPLNAGLLTRGFPMRDTASGIKDWLGSKATF